MRTFRAMSITFVGVLLLTVAAVAVGGGNGEESESETAEMTEAGEAGAYVPYSEVRFRDAADKKRVYFFHAGWCPTCRSANKAFEDNLDRIPADVVVFKTDYDTSGELKQRYAVTYQHTFVLVDQEGNQVRKWSGGDIDELIENTKGSL
jgi:thiol-disulfide isomerase/thioredoxin